MCLVTAANKKPKIAEQDITVYKVVKIAPTHRWDNLRLSECGYVDGVGNILPLKLKTPFTGDELIPGFFNTITYAEGDPTGKGIGRGLRQYGKGWIHSYPDLDTAMKSLNSSLLETPSICVECIIPKGTGYIEGKNSTLIDYDTPTIASRRIKYTNKVHGLKMTNYTSFFDSFYEFVSSEEVKELFCSKTMLMDYLQKHFNLDFVDDNE